MNTTPSATLDEPPPTNEKPLLTPKETEQLVSFALSVDGKDHRGLPPDIHDTVVMHRADSSLADTIEIPADEIRKSILATLSRSQTDLLDKAERFSRMSHKSLEQARDAGMYDPYLKPKEKEALISDIDAVVAFKNGSLAPAISHVLGSLRRHLKQDLLPIVKIDQVHTPEVDDYLAAKLKFMTDVHPVPTLSERLKDIFGKIKKLKIF